MHNQAILAFATSTTSTTITTKTNPFLNQSSNPSFSTFITYALMQNHLFVAATRRSLLALTIVIATTFAAFAQINPNIQFVTSNSIPATAIANLIFLPTVCTNPTTDNLVATVNSTAIANFRAYADGPLSLKIKLTHTGSRDANHLVKIDFYKPSAAGFVLVETKPRVVVKYNTPVEVTFNAIAGISESGCGIVGNKWRVITTNIDDVNEQTTKLEYTACTISGTSTRTTYPAAAFSLAQGAAIDRVFSIPAGHDGTLTIKTNYTGTAPLKMHLYKPTASIPFGLTGTIMPPVTITANGGTFTYAVKKTDVSAGATDTNWHIIALNTATSALTDSNIIYEVKFQDCFE